jgi:hypothetical protein
MGDERLVYTESTSAMQALDVWKSAAMDQSNFLEGLIDLLTWNRIRYCVIGGQGVNAYVEPLIGRDFDLVVAVDHLELVESLLRERFRVERFPHSLNVCAEDSDLRVQIQTDPRYFGFPDRATERDVLGLQLPVASVEDVLDDKIWAALSEAGQPSKRRKDLLDIERLIESFPRLRSQVPAGILEKLSLL